MDEDAPELGPAVHFSFDDIDHGCNTFFLDQLAKSERPDMRGRQTHQPAIGRKVPDGVCPHEYDCRSWEEYLQGVNILSDIRHSC